jgi:hypothetical protein
MLHSVHIHQNKIQIPSKTTTDNNWPVKVSHAGRIATDGNNQILWLEILNDILSEIICRPML